MALGIDVSFDCVGFKFNKAMSTALSATAAGGKVCLFGLAQSEMTIPLTPAALREVDVIGIFRFEFSQKGIEDAFQTSAGGGNAIKVMFNL
ncbi:hypothetical protein REPUB_Repub07fG0125000 [Reevesia pubescens]